MRVEYVDVFRGLALIVMVSIQIFDYLSVSNIYTSEPYYVEAINSVTWAPPSLLFAFVSGMSVSLLIKKKKKIMSVVKRYGIYIVFSLPFTTFMWDFQTFFAWNEVIQGIGLTAIIASFFVNKKARTLVPLIIVLAVLQSWLPLLIDSAGISNVFPREAGTRLGVLVSLLLNMSVRGWFSIINILPIMLGGALFLRGLKSRPERTMMTGALVLLASAVLHFAGLGIDYYGRSVNLTFFAVGESALMCSALFIMFRKKCRILNALKVFGRATIVVYLGHYLFILKVLELTGNKDLLPDWMSWLLTAGFMVIIYYLTKYYLKMRGVETSVRFRAQES